MKILPDRSNHVKAGRDGSNLPKKSLSAIICVHSKNGCSLIGSLGSHLDMSRCCNWVSSSKVSIKFTEKNNPLQLYKDNHCSVLKDKYVKNRKLREPIRIKDFDTEI